MQFDTLAARASFEDRSFESNPEEEKYEKKGKKEISYF